MSQVKTLHSEEYLKRKRKSRYWKIFFVFIFFILIILSLSLLSFYKQLRIDNIRVVAPDSFDQDILKSDVSSLIEKKYFHLFSKENIFIYPKKELVSFLKSKFPNIDTVDITAVDKNTLLLNIKERVPFALWCDSLPKEDHISKCYFLDSSGFVFAKAPQFSGDAYFKYYGILPEQSPIGSYFLKTPGRFKEVSDFFSYAKTLSISPIYLVASGENYFELFLFGGARVIFDTVEPIKESAKRLGILVKTENILQKDGGSILVDYIDLRFGNKIFYKNKISE
jgi:hypothetical protein